MSHDPYTLPPDLPCRRTTAPPRTSRACGSRGSSCRPPTSARSTSPRPPSSCSCSTSTRARACPGQALPTGWDDIPGARGCTPQACAFRDLHAEIAAAGAHTLGLSAQTVAEQHEVVERLDLPYALASDPLLTVAEALDLPTFEVDGMQLYKRITLIADRGGIVKVFYPVFPPNRNAQDVLEWLQANR